MTLDDSSQAAPAARGTVLAIAYRPTSGDDMQEIQSMPVSQDGFLAGEHRQSPDRGLTLLSAEAWQDTCRELGADLPWHTRRVNLLVEGLSLGEMIGAELQIGQVRLKVLDETKPCGLMDKLHPGLRAALEPAYRGGVFGRILNNGEIQVGDSITRIG